MKSITIIVLVNLMNSIILQGADNIRDRNQISKELLKEEIQRLTIPIVRQKMHKAEQESVDWNMGYLFNENLGPYIATNYLTFKNIFSVDVTDQRTQEIVNRVRAIESSPYYKEKMEIGVNGEFILATPKKIDDFTRYNHDVDSDGKSIIVCTTQIIDKKVMEDVMTEMQQ